MRQLFTILIAVLLVPAIGRAQQAGPQVFTLEQCIDYALKNSVSAQNAALDERIAEAKVKETIGLGLPQVSGDVALSHNEKLPRFFSTYQTAQGFGGTNEDGSPVLDIPGVEPTDVIASQNFFQLKSSGTASLTINQLIFNGSYIVGLQASKAYKDLSYKTTAQTREQIIQAVTKAYYTVLINKERASLFTSNIARVDSLLKDIKAMHANGFVESIDADRIRVQLNNLIAERDKFQNFNELGLELLKFQMNYPMEQTIDVAGNIQDVQVNASLDSYSTNWNYKERPDYQVMEANYKLQALNLRNQYAMGMPTIGAFANLGKNTQSPDIGGLFKTNTDISDNGMLGPDKWYGFSTFGVSLSVPIFSGLQRTYKIKQEKLALQKIENGFKNLKSGIDLETKQATTTFENAGKTLTIQKENMDLAANVARITKIKYEQGVGSNLEVTNAEDDLRQAQTNYYSALYDFVLAKVDLDKAYGKLAAPVQEN